MTDPDDELLDAILRELDAQAAMRRAADVIERGGTLKRRWAAEHLRSVAGVPAWRDEAPK